MKTLDEVIAELEDEGLFADALFYLKEYREKLKGDEGLFADALFYLKEYREKLKGDDNGSLERH